jgi:hypothetical protein
VGGSSVDKEDVKEVEVGRQQEIARRLDLANVDS